MDYNRFAYEYLRISTNIYRYLRISSHLPFASKSVIRRELARCVSVLDIGCGARAITSSSLSPTMSTGIDIFLPSLESAKNASPHFNYVLCDARCLPFIEKSFDAVVAIDVIEHLNKKEASKMIVQMCDLAKRKVVLQTTNGFLPQSEYGGNPYQVHRSGWTFSDLRRHGFRVLGVRGLRQLRGELCRPRIKPSTIGDFISFITYPLGWFLPRAAFQLIGVRGLAGEKRRRAQLLKGRRDRLCASSRSR